jgi:hypothetical protein
VIEIRYKHSLIIPSSLASPDLEKGVNKEWISSPIDWMALETSVVVPWTIMGIKAIAKSTMIIRHTQGFMIPSSYSKSWPLINSNLFHYFFHFRSLKRPQMNMIQIASSAILYSIDMFPY